MTDSHEGAEYELAIEAAKKMFQEKYEVFNLRRNSYGIYQFSCSVNGEVFVDYLYYIENIVFIGMPTKD